MVPREVVMDQREVVMDQREVVIGAAAAMRMMYNLQPL